MRTSRLAITTCTALLGLGTLISQANPASAAPPKGPKTIELAPTTTTTVKPMGPDVMVLPPIVDPPVDPDLPLAQPADDACNPKMGPCDLAIPDPGKPECDPKLGSCDLGTPPGKPECDPKLGSCDLSDKPHDDTCVEDSGRPPCDSHGGTDSGTDGQTPGGTTGGTTGGDRLPHTGTDVATYGLAGLGFIGLGVALKRLGRRAA